jgi:hypothetical protein
MFPARARGDTLFPMRLKMKDKLDEALSLAAEINLEARLVRIIGIGVHQDGTVHLDNPNDYESRWEYAFKDDKDGESPPLCLTVLYYNAGQRLVDKNAGNVPWDMEYFDEEIIDELRDSDDLAELFADEDDFKPLSGSGSDVILYTMRRALDPVAIISNWKGQNLMLDPIGGEVFFGSE